MPKVTKINHIAVAVNDIEKSLSFWRDALGLELAELRDVPAESAQIAFLPVGGTEVELVRPTRDDSGLAKYLAKNGAGMHHLCFETDDIEGRKRPQYNNALVYAVNDDTHVNVS